MSVDFKLGLTMAVFALAMIVFFSALCFMTF